MAPEGTSPVFLDAPQVQMLVAMLSVLIDLHDAEYSTYVQHVLHTCVQTYLQFVTSKIHVLHSPGTAKSNVMIQIMQSMTAVGLLAKYATYHISKTFPL